MSINREISKEFERRADAYSMAAMDLKLTFDVPDVKPFIQVAEGMAIISETLAKNLDLVMVYNPKSLEVIAVFTCAKLEFEDVKQAKHNSFRNVNMIAP